MSLLANKLGFLQGKVLANSLLRATTQSQSRSITSTSAVFSNIGKLSIPYPSTVQIELADGPINETDLRFRNTRTLTVTGPLGNLKLPILPFVQLINTPPISSDATKAASQNSEDNETNKGHLNISVDSPSVKKQRQMWGTTRALIQNMVTGVTEGYTATLRMVGVGYRANLDKVDDLAVLQLKLGYSHPVIIPIPDHLTVTVPFPTVILVNGTDLQQVKLFAAKVREKKKPEPYNQKGIFVNDETIKKKEGKKK